MCQEKTIEALRAELDATANLKLEDAIPIVSTALNGQQLFVPLESYDQESGELQLLTGKDAAGNIWIYAYTGKDIMQAAGLAGTQCGEFEFLELISIARKGPFAGIAIDGGGNSTRAFIPDYWFAEIDRVLRHES